MPKSNPSIRNTNVQTSAKKSRVNAFTILYRFAWYVGMSASKHIVYEKSLIPRSCHPDCCAWSGPESSACSCLGKFLMHTGTSMVGPLGLCRSPRWVGVKAMSRVNDIAQSKTFADRRNRPGRFQGGSGNGPPVKHLKFKQCNQE